MTESRVVMVMSGGGAKAAAHLGAHRALEEAGIRPTGYVATSMGAVMAALFAAGLTYQEALERVLGIRTEEVVQANRLALFRGLFVSSVFKPGPLRSTLERLVPVRRFGDLKAPLTVTATDFDTGELTLFGTRGRDVPLLDALYASCALPVFYPPLELEGRHYVDGGLRTVLPIEIAAESGAARVIAIDTGPGFDEYATPAPPVFPAVVQAHSDATGMLMAANTRATLALWHATPGRPPLVYVRPTLPRGATFRVDLLRGFVEEGHRATVLALSSG